MQNITSLVPNTQKTESCSTFSHLLLIKSYQIWSRSNKNKKMYANDPKNFWQVSENWRKV